MIRLLTLALVLAEPGGPARLGHDGLQYVRIPHRQLWLTWTEVTLAAYKRFLAATGGRLPGPRAPRTNRAGCATRGR